MPYLVRVFVSYVSSGFFYISWLILTICIYSYLLHYCNQFNANNIVSHFQVRHDPPRHSRRRVLFLSFIFFWHKQPRITNVRPSTHMPLIGIYTYIAETWPNLLFAAPENVLLLRFIKRVYSVNFIMSIIRTYESAYWKCTYQTKVYLNYPWFIISMYLISIYWLRIKGSYCWTRSNWEQHCITKV